MTNNQRKVYIKRSYILIKNVNERRRLKEREYNVFKKRILQLINEDLPDLEKNYLFKFVYKRKLLSLYIDLELYNNGGKM